MVTTRRHHRYTYADYVGVEKYSDTKHEYFDGDSASSSRIANAGSRCIAAMEIGGSCVARSRGRVTVETLGAELVVDAIYRNSSIG